MSHDDACDRARRALMEVCGDDNRFNTVFVEVVAEQGRRIDSADLNEMTEWVKETVEGKYDPDGLPREMRLETRDVFVIPGTERPQETKELSDRGRLSGGTSSTFHTSPNNRIHAFMPFENNTLQITQLQAVLSEVRRSWEDSAVSRGRGLLSVNVVDPAVARAAAPQRTGRPLEDAEVF